MELPLVTQDPDEVLDYVKDWTDELAGDTIATSTWSILPTGPTLSGTASTTTSATVFVASIAAGAMYSLLNTVVTAGGRTYQSGWSIWGESR